MTHKRIEFTAPSRNDIEAEFMVDLGDFPGTLSINMVGDAESWANVPVEACRELIKAMEDLIPRAERGETREWG